MVLRKALPTALALVLTFGLAGCGSDPDSAPPTPGAPTPMTTADMSSEVETLYTEAEQLVSEIGELQMAYLMDADDKQYPVRFEELIDEPYLEQHEGMYADLKEKGRRISPDAEIPMSFQWAPEELAHDAEVAIWVCQDSRQAPALDASGEIVAEGNVSTTLHYFKQFDGTLKLFRQGTYMQVDECP